MKPVSLGRRSLLRGTAGVAISLPWLEAMSGRARAATGLPKRLVVVANVLGTFPEHFWPRPLASPAWPAGYRPQKKYVSGATALDTTDFQLEPICKSFEAHKKDLLYVEGLEPGNCNGHGGYCQILSGTTPAPQGPDDSTSGGPSLDQVIAARIGKDSRFSSLQIGVGSGGSEHYGTLSFYEARKGAPADGNPRTVWDRVFANVAAGGGVVDQTAFLRAQKQRRLVLDGALNQATALKARLGSADQAKLDNYLDSFRDLETRITRTATVMGCSKPGMPAAPSRGGGTDAWPEIANLQIENLAMAFTCDLTRVATLQFGFEGQQVTFPWLAVTTRHHDLSHCDYDSANAPEQYLNIAKINTWNAEMVLALVTRLKQIPEGSGTVFDNTLILWINTLTYGATHSNSRTPTVLLGSAGGAFRTGRFVRLATGTKRSLADLFVQIGRAYGLESSTFGDGKFNYGSLDLLRA